MKDITKITEMKSAPRFAGTLPFTFLRLPCYFFFDNIIDIKGPNTSLGPYTFLNFYTLISCIPYLQANVRSLQPTQLKSEPMQPGWKCYRFPGFKKIIPVS